MIGFLTIAALFMLVVQLTMHFLISRFEKIDGSKLARFCLIANIFSVIGIGIGFTSNMSDSSKVILIQSISIWLMFQIFVIVGLAVLWLCRYFFQKSMDVPMDESRRKFAKAALVVPCVAAGSSLYGSFVENEGTVVHNYTLPVENLGKGLQGFKIAQLSDVHLGPFFDLADFEKLLEHTVNLKPNALVLTGDVFDDAKLTMQAAKLLDSYVDSFPQGIFYCRGNHEHFRGIPLLEIALANTRIHNLVNSNVLVADDERPLYIAGADYPMDREEFDFLQESYTAQALANIPDNAVKVLLAHNPRFVESAANYQAELVLSGHTHGGQLGFMGIPLAPPVFKYMRGWYHQAKTALYVHCGNGSWFPFRFGCPPEIAVFELVKK